MRALRLVLVSLCPGPLTVSFGMALAGERYSLWFWRDVAGLL